MTVIGFYGTQGKYGGFSNFYKADFVVNGQPFSCTEQYIMYQKAKLFGDMEIAERILTLINPVDMKRLGRQVKNYKDDWWEVNRFELCKIGIWAKFAQNDNLKNLLIETGNMIIAECSPYDRIWGIGLSINHPDVQNPERWRGRNVLGDILMDVRRELR